MLWVLASDGTGLLNGRHRRPRSLWSVTAKWTRPGDVSSKLRILHHRTPNRGIDIGRRSIRHDTLGLLSDCTERRQPPEAVVVGRHKRASDVDWRSSVSVVAPNNRLSVGREKLNGSCLPSWSTPEVG